MAANATGGGICAMELRAEINGLLDGYLKWLRDNTVFEQIDEAGGCAVLTTPHIDRHNDMLQVVVSRTREGYEISDDGYILADLAAGGCHFNSSARQAMLHETVNGFAVRIEDEVLVTSASKDNFPRRKHSLVQAMLAVNDMAFVVRARRSPYFARQVREWLDAKEVRCVRKSRISGQSGYAHEFDFVIPARAGTPERLLKTIGSPNRRTAMKLIMAWQDVRPTRPTAKIYALLDNTAAPASNSVSEALRRYDITPVQWSERERFAGRLAASPRDRRVTAV